MRIMCVGETKNTLAHKEEPFALARSCLVPVPKFLGAIPTAIELGFLVVDSRCFHIPT